MRLAVYTDYMYHRVEGEVFAERAFALFLAELALRVDRLVVVGRLHPGDGNARYPLGDVDLVELPYYRSLAEPLAATRAMFGSIGRFWRALDEVDAVWLLGPHPLVFVYAFLAIARRRRVVLGVRQEFIRYIGSRHPGRPVIKFTATTMELGFRLLARVLPVVVVGPNLANTYRRSRSLLEIVVSLVRRDDIVSSFDQVPRDYRGPVKALSVGRLDAEKNPLALADVLALLRGSDRAWRLVVCGEGPLEEPLRSRLAELGLSESADLRGYVAHGPDLQRAYLESDALLHVSWTEGVPQVLFEAFAAGLPVVATDVGGVRSATQGAALLIPPGEPAAAAAALRRLASDEDLRRSLVTAGIAHAQENSLEHQTERVARFIESPAVSADRSVARV